ncbi:uncharacterized protein LY79DRAFT_542427 [Colletotrichum navitas]|uniref:Secreted protein n=1 Tax=Colletotrichum navitas TaxID=681940 RepID=A0AAD8V8R9_9PEZI|nr:uncharacterized protein LY79DRAFT_542427 [Colletotrichum navitas]KAK1597184.1 hypothetical protein LY79DRAFT_542427 [Colletotrichum navitas]
MRCRLVIVHLVLVSSLCWISEREAQAFAWTDLTGSVGRIRLHRRSCSLSVESTSTWHGILASRTADQSIHITESSPNKSASRRDGELGQ